ncbi:unnamed protein product [Allacma fusca]|uniref:Ubiquitin carboxyl-terminal hydrolase MINDY n=1 Tax=Allacma fusca TaxID=39272 RepID=A0A8J2Q7N9_9HEXA|nr:unnamed protein product [Allacma fusca]
MNPMFTRRNRSMAISSQQHNNGQKSGLITNPSRPANPEDSQVERLSPDLSPEGSSNLNFGDRYEDSGHRPTRKLGGTAATATKVNSAASFAQNLLASKQNMLAQVSLTPEENLERQGSNGEDSAHQDSTFFVKDPTKIERRGVSEGQIHLRDIEDEDFEFGEVTPEETECISRQHPPGNGNMSGRRFGGDGRPQIKVMDTQMYRDLKMATVGPNGSFQEGWLNQGFNFDTQVPYGLVQKRGGPCGVLAVVQALVLRNLIFGTPYCEDDDIPLPDPSIMFNATEPMSLRMLNYRKSKALVCALTEIVWRCANVGKKALEVETPSASLCDFSIVRAEHETGSAVVCFSGASIGSEYRTFEQMTHLKNYIHVNLAKFDCVTLVYSAVLSRGIDNVQEDLDFPNCPLIVSHGYCSQELVNLLTIGKAISNVFDNQVSLDEKILKGIESRSDIGLLSLFEHYDSCQVGNFLKCPKFPLWIVCSESHFSLLFSTDMALVLEPPLDKFELYYYDGLARQHNHIKLTIEINRTGRALVPKRRPDHLRIQAGSSAASFNNNNNNNNDGDDDELVPPIDKCIRTKWRNAHVDWNETEPIL